MENKAEKKKVNSKILWKTILAVLCMFAAYKVGAQCLAMLPLNTIVALFIREVWLLVCALVGAAVLKKLNVLKLTGKGFGAGILAGLLLLIQPAFSVVLQIIGHFPVTVSVWGVVLFVITMVLVGIGEELMFRGVLLGGCLEAYGEDSTGAIRKAVVVSGVVFGLLHVFNFLTGAPIASTLVQGIGNIGSGMLFGAIYVRSGKNLWPGVVLHAWLDYSSFTGSGILNGASFSDTISDYSPLNLITGLVMLLVALFVLRDKKLQPLVKNAGEAAGE